MENLKKLNSCEKGFYYAWKYSGETAKTIFRNKNTATKYRKILKDKLGIDIYKPYLEDTQ